MVDIADTGQAPRKNSAMLVTAAAVLVVTAVAGAGGWFLGGLVSPALDASKQAILAETARADAEASKKAEEGLPTLATEDNGVVQLEPITTNLSFPSDRWVRLEVALLFKDKPDVKTAEAIHQDILAYLRTVTLEQIEGPRGFQYLKEDLEERADLISEGRISRMLFRTFVIE